MPRNSEEGDIVSACRNLPLATFDDRLPIKQYIRPQLLQLFLAHYRL